MNTEQTSRLGRGLWIGLALGLTAVVALSIYSDTNALAGKLTTYDLRWFAAGTACATLNYVLRFVRWQYYLGRIGASVPLVASARIFVAGFAMSVSPGKLGEVLKSALLAEAHDVPVERSAPIVLAERLTDLVALVILVAIGSLSVPDAGAIALMSAGVVAGIYLVLAFPPLGRFVLSLVERTRLGARIGPRLRDAHDALVTLLRPLPLLGASLLATAAWFLECVSLYLIVRGFEGVSLSIGASTFAYSAPTIIGALAMLPGGLLVTEASMTGVLRTLGGSLMTEPVAAGATLLVRLATLWWAVVLGLAALAWQRRTVAPSTPNRGTKPRPDGRR